MSGSRIMTWEGKKLNPRDEEKVLDDKLLDLGLLEPGMTLQEKRDMASAVLESTKMAQEQMSQKSEEEQWEVMLVSKEDNKYSDNATSKGTEIDNNTDDSESTSVVQVSVNVQDDRDGQCIGHREFSRADGDSRLAGNQRERRNKDVTRRKRDVEKRAGRFERDDDRVSLANTKREKDKYDEDKRKREKDMRTKEVDGGREQGEIQKRKREKNERREDRMRGETRKAELEILIKKSETKGCSIDVLDTQKPNKEKNVEEVNITKDSFYGPSYLRDVKHPNPFHSEIYGSAQKNHSHRVSKESSLIQLAEETMQNKGVRLIEECMKKQSSSHQDDAKGKIIGVKELDRSSKEKDLSLEKHEDQGMILRIYRKNKKIGDVEDSERYKESPGKENDDVFSKSKERAQRQREAKKRGEPSKTVSVEREGGLSSQSGNLDRNRASSLSNHEKRRRREANSDSSSAEEEVKEIELEGEGEEDDILNADVKTLGEKKRRLDKSHLAKQWSDVVNLKKSEEMEERDLSKEETVTKERTKPNKRWRRVRRKFKSSFGSGSELDEWISSEEERKTKIVPLTKEQIGAKFDDYLTRLRNELKKQGLKESDKRTEKVCSNSRRQRSKYKVPPGFQEPDSDDDLNLWKICFADKTSVKSKLGKDDTKTDVTQSSSRKVMTRSQMKQDGCLSPCSFSKSPSSVEEDHLMRRSPLCLSPMKAISGSSTHPNDDVCSTSKSSLKEIKHFDKVMCPIPRISKGTQTLWDNDMDSTQSSSSSATVVNSNPKAKDDNRKTKPVWDLFVIDSEAEGGVETLENRRKNEDDEELVNENVCNVTLRRPKIDVRNSPVYLPVEPSEDDAALSVSDGVKTPDGIGGITEHLSIEPVCEPSVSRATRRNLYKENTSRLRDRPERRMQKKVDEKVKRNAEEENEQEVQLISEEESPVELPELVACPICNHAYPMSEIEAHASGCNPEEDDESSEGEVSIAPPLAKGHHHMSQGVTAGASCQRLKMEVDEEMDYNDDNDFEDPEDEECKPRPPPLATFIPISQQKDSLIDYSDQFPRRSGGVNLQSSLERMRKSLMRGGKRRSGWKKRKRGKWRRVAKK